MKHIKPNVIILVQEGKLTGKMIYIRTVNADYIHGWGMTKYNSEIKSNKTMFHLKTSVTDSWVFFKPDRKIPCDTAYMIIEEISSKEYKKIQSAFNFFRISRQRIRLSSGSGRGTPKNIASIVSGGKVNPR